MATARAVREGQVRARAVVEAALERIAARDRILNCFTAVTAEAALVEAERLDRALAAGRDPGPLAGVPFAVKNLLDVAGLPTLAGSRINRERLPAARDAAAVRALRRAGAVLVGTLNMHEYAYGFTTENAHYGPTRNPHDPDRVAGGSSGGSAAAVAGGLVPLTLGSDTNGSIRVPAALCGVFGLKPTFGRVSRAGAAFLAWSLDHVGPLARSARDLAAAFDALQGPDPDDPAASERPPAPCAPLLEGGTGGLRLAVLDGYFAAGADPAALEVVADVARALGVTARVTLPEAHRARAAAQIVTAAEAASLHLPDLRTRARDFDPLTRGRFLAGALVPAAAYAQAQRFRAWFRARVAEVFRKVDVLIAPTTPCPAPRIGQARIPLGATVVPPSHLGLYTQPISFVGLPVVAVPVRRAGLPLGVQLIGRPFEEAALLRVAAALEAKGVAAAPVARGA